LDFIISQEELLVVEVHVLQAEALWEDDIIHVQDHVHGPLLLDVLGPPEEEVIVVPDPEVLRLVMKRGGDIELDRFRIFLSFIGNDNHKTLRKIQLLYCFELSCYYRYSPNLGIS
jgi:hypothetical protein